MAGAWGSSRLQSASGVASGLVKVVPARDAPGSAQTWPMNPQLENSHQDRIYSLRHQVEEYGGRACSLVIK